MDVALAADRRRVAEPARHPLDRLGDVALGGGLAVEALELAERPRGQHGGRPGAEVLGGEVVARDLAQEVGATSSRRPATSPLSSASSATSASTTRPSTPGSAPPSCRTCSTGADDGRPDPDREAGAQALLWHGRGYVGVFQPHLRRVRARHHQPRHRRLQIRPALHVESQPLRAFWQLEPNGTVGMLIAALLKYRRATMPIAGGATDQEGEASWERCRAIAERLKRLVRRRPTIWPMLRSRPSTLIMSTQRGAAPSSAASRTRKVPSPRRARCSRGRCRS